MLIVHASKLGVAIVLKRLKEALGPGIFQQELLSLHTGGS